MDATLANIRLGSRLDGLFPQSIIFIQESLK
jgi:hypothetical protein